MNLTTCPDCGSQVSRRAAACPKCGGPIAAPAVPIHGTPARPMPVELTAKQWKFGRVMGWMLAVGGVVIAFGSAVNQFNVGIGIGIFVALAGIAIAAVSALMGWWERG